MMRNVINVRPRPAPFSPRPLSPVLPSALSLSLQTLSSINFFCSPLCPQRWLLLQRLSCLHLPAKESGLLLSFTYSLLSSLTSFTGSSELLVQHVIRHLAALRNEELELHPLVPFVRLLSLIPWMERLDAWTQLISGVVQLLGRLNKVEMSDLEEWQHRFGLTYKGMSMNWRVRTKGGKEQRKANCWLGRG